MPCSCAVPRKVMRGPPSRLTSLRIKELRLASELNRQSSVSRRRLVTKPKALNEQNKTLKRQCRVRVVRHGGGGADRMHNLRRTSARSHGVCVAAGGRAAPGRGGAGGVSRRSDSNRN